MGRIANVQVWDYIDKLQTSTTRVSVPHVTIKKQFLVIYTPLKQFQHLAKAVLAKQQDSEPLYVYICASSSVDSIGV